MKNLKLLILYVFPTLIIILLLTSSVAFGQTFKSSDINNFAILKSPFPPKYIGKGELDCPPGSQFSQPAEGYSNAVISDTDGGYKTLQHLIGSTNISSITFWGINAYYDGLSWSLCSEDPRDFEIVFYGDNSGEPDTNNVLYTFNVNLDGFETGELYAGAYEILRYSYLFTPNLTGCTESWVSIQGNPGTPNNSCWFMWINSGTPGTVSLLFDESAGTWEPTTYTQSLCLSGELLVSDLGVTAIVQPNSGVGLGMETVEVQIANFGGNDQTGFNIFYQINGGAPVSEIFTGTITSGEVVDYTFSTLADLSGVGDFIIHACTDLIGDMNPANDCTDKVVNHYEPYECDMYVVGWDDYGDSWNDGYIDIYIDGDLHHTWAGPISSGPDTLRFGVYQACYLDIEWIGGGWEYEASYCIFDADDIVIACDGLDGENPVGIIGLPGYCPIYCCPPPTLLTVTNITDTSADLGWSDLYIPIQWEIELGVTGFIPTGNGILVNTNPYTWDGLSPNTTYDWYIKSIYSPFDHSTWTGPYTFTTLHPPPSNDICVSAQFVTVPFPTVVYGTTSGATIDCPGIFDWKAVWYEIELPYECNYVQLDLCLVNIDTILNDAGLILIANCSCDSASMIYSDSLWSISENCINELNFNVPGPGTVYYPLMVDPQGDFTFDIDITELYGIDGTLTYANSITSPMVLDEVTIDDGTDVVVGTTLTDLTGYYHFAFVTPGSYILGGSTTNTWGGLSMNDVQFARQYVTNQPSGNGLTGLYLEAGDVDQDGYLLMNDVLAMWQQSTNNPPGFTPFWLFDNPGVMVGPSAIQNFQVICSGDMDGSYVPSSSK